MTLHQPHHAEHDGDFIEPDPGEGLGAMVAVYAAWLLIVGVVIYALIWG